MIWSFERQGQRVQCEIRRDADEQHYEFVVTNADGGEETELYDDPSAVIARSVEYMRVLIEGGWSSSQLPSPLR
jgi:hypothetical protein